MTTPVSKNTINAGYIKSVVIKNASTRPEGVEVSDLVTELNIFQSIQVPFMTGKILLVDAVSLLDNVMLLGNDQIDIYIESKSTGGKQEEIYISMFTTGIEKAEKQKENNIYVLSLASKHIINNAYTRINQAYNGKSSDIIKKIAIDKLKVNETDLDIEDTMDNLKVIIPNLKISESLMWIARRATSESKTPCFVYEYLDGSIGFNSLAKMYSRPSVITYYRSDTQSSDPQTTYAKIIDFQADSVGNGYLNFSNGAFAAKTYAFDTMTKQLIEEKFDLRDYEKDETVLNTTIANTGVNVEGKTVYELPESKVYYLLTSSDGSNSNRPDITTTNDTFGDYHTNSEIKIPYLNSKLMQLENFMLSITVQGNINVFPGAIISLVVPSANNSIKGQEVTNDLLYSGNYVVVSIKHSFNAQNHVTMLQIAKDSLAFRKKA